MKWNQWSKEVEEERRKVRDYGGPGKAPRHDDTYKAQALRLLAESQIMESQIADLQHRVQSAVDLLDGASASQIASAFGIQDNEAQAILNRILAK